MTVARRTRTEIERLLVELRLTGSNLAHSRANNLENVRRLAAGELGVTLGIDVVEREVVRGSLTPERGLATIASLTGCSSDLDRDDGLGYIEPVATYDGLRHAARTIAAGIERGERFLFATGHPSNMLPAYEELAAYVERRGCGVVTEAPGAVPPYHGQSLELRGRTYVATQDGQPAHTHHSELVRDLLERTGPVGLAVADHGFAGAALNRGIPTVCVMDTNDPGVALARALGAPVTVVPMNDNATGDAVRHVAEIIVEMIEEDER